MEIYGRALANQGFESPRLQASLFKLFGKDRSDPGREHRKGDYSRSMDILAGPGSRAPIGHLVAHLEHEEIADDPLRLIFTCCHPALPPEGQAALTLREICGLTWRKKCNGCRFRSLATTI
jgi:hypothetical protein